MRYTILSILLFTACATPLAINKTCVPIAFSNAIAWEQETGNRARIIYCHTDDPNMDHAQAQGEIDGQWIYLKEYSDKTGRKYVDVGKDECGGFYAIYDLRRALDLHYEKAIRKRLEIK